MKIDRKKLADALAYRTLINITPFKELDFSEYPEFKALDKKEIELFRFTGLTNVDFIRIMLLRE